MKALLTLLKTDRAQVDAFSIEQVVALCGTGKLADNSETCHEFREYLQIADSENLFKYLETCLRAGFEKSGVVLQDIVNELGRRLDYTVENGLYQGRSNAIGYDGLWTAPSGHVIVVEVKTTDAYRIMVFVLGFHAGPAQDCYCHDRRVPPRRDTGKAPTNHLHGRRADGGDGSTPLAGRPGPH
jgi:hypothetical protein